MSTKVLFYAVWISMTQTSRDQGRSALRWGPPRDTVSEAQRDGRAEVRAGRASLSVVVEFAGGEKTPLARTVCPESARKIVRHWEEIWDATEPSSDK